MRKIVYSVGCDGYFTTCLTYETAQKQKAKNPRYIIKARLENIEEPASKNSPLRQKMLDQFGYVNEKLKDKIS